MFSKLSTDKAMAEETNGRRVSEIALPNREVYKSACCFTEYLLKRQESTNKRS